MQARFTQMLLAGAAAVALTCAATASAVETEHDRHVFVNNAAGNAPQGEGSARSISPGTTQADPHTDGLLILRSAEQTEAGAGSANGGVWRTTNRAGAAQPAANDVQTRTPTAC